MVLTEYDEKKHISNEKQISWEEGELSGKFKSVRNLMKNRGFSLDEALVALEVSLEEWNKYNDVQ